MTGIAFLRSLVGSAIVFCGCAPIAATATASFELPKPKRITLDRPLDCRALATATISEKDGHLEAETKRGTDHLTVLRVGHTLRVIANHEASQVADETDVYTITHETEDFVSAVQGVKMVPVVHGFVINTRLGTAVWSESGDPSDPLVSIYPFAVDVFMGCEN